LIGSAAIYLVISLVVIKVNKTNPLNEMEKVGKMVIQNTNLGNKEEML
jgi:hypothetical protein